MVTGRRLLRGALAATALGWAAVGLLLGSGSCCPPRTWACSGRTRSWTSSPRSSRLSLWLAVFAVLGLALATLARRAGLRRSSLVAAVLGVVTVALSLVPVVQGWRTASQEGVALSLSEYFSFPSIRSPETVTYARPEGGAQARRPAPAGRRRHRGTGAETGGGHGARRRWGLWRP